VIVSCDELNAVASGATEEEALRNLEQAFGALMETYDEEMKQRLAKR
jgi:predicted RNase H-like HicB family nuclease